MARVKEGTTLSGFTCDAQGCDAVAVYAPCIMTPIEGFAPDAKAPLMSQVDVHVCPRHVRSVKIDDLISKPMLDSIEEAAIAKGEGRPAHKRRYLEFVRCHSPEFLSFQQRAGLVPPDDALVKGPGIIMPG